MSLWKCERCDANEPCYFDSGCSNNCEPFHCPIGGDKQHWVPIKGKMFGETEQLQKTDGEQLTVRFKKLHPDAKVPYQGTPGSAGWDLTAVSKVCMDSKTVKYFTGLAVEIPEGHVGFVFPRSSVYKTGQMLTNCVGVIDSDYRGEITAVFATKIGNKDYNVGDRIMQLVIMPYPAVKFVEAEELTETERGTGGYGSTGK